MFSKTVNLKIHERAFVHIDGTLQKILPPGKHRLNVGFKSVRVEIFSINNLEFQHELTEHLLANPTPEITSFFVIIKLSHMAHHIKESYLSLVYKHY